MLQHVEGEGRGESTPFKGHVHVASANPSTSAFDAKLEGSAFIDGHCSCVSELLCGRMLYSVMREMRTKRVPVPSVSGRRCDGGAAAEGEPSSTRAAWEGGRNSAQVSFASILWLSGATQGCQQEVGGISCFSFRQRT
jgi:hypothetical protein